MSSERPRLKPQHAPKAPHEDEQFLESTPARPLRILAEYINPLAQLKREGIGDTIVMFGSARLDSHEVASARLTRLKDRKISKLNAAEERAGNVALLRRGAATVAQDYDVGAVAGTAAEAVCGLLGRRAGDYGGGESRRV